MILIDVNILIYAYTESVEQHHDARQWLEDAFARRDLVGIAWSTIHSKVLVRFA
jgi:predicted nucleic acid-binding protein